MSFWGASISQLTTVRSDAQITITHAALRNGESMPPGSVAALLAQSKNGAGWVTVAKFRTNELESVGLRFIVHPSSELTFKVRAMNPLWLQWSNRFQGGTG